MNKLDYTIPRSLELKGVALKKVNNNWVAFWLDNGEEIYSIKSKMQLIKLLNHNKKDIEEVKNAKKGIPERKPTS